MRREGGRESTDTQTHRHTRRHTDTHTHTHSLTHTDTQTHRHTDTHTHLCLQQREQALGKKIGSASQASLSFLGNTKPAESALFAPFSPNTVFFFGLAWLSFPFFLCSFFLFTSSSPQARPINCSAHILGIQTHYKRHART